MATAKKSRIANVYFRSHRDCFVHGVFREWSSWLNVATIGGHALRLVILHFPNDLNLVTIFSTKPCQAPGFPNEQLEETYLEIDSELAKCLFVMEDEGIQVLVETLSESDIEVCSKAVIAPLNPNDHDFMMLNWRKLGRDLMKQVRVVSSVYPFLFWINNQSMRLRLVKSEPPAKWVLLVDGTELKTPSPPLPSPSVVSVTVPSRIGSHTTPSTTMQTTSSITSQPRGLSFLPQSNSDIPIQAATSMPFVCTPSSDVDKEDPEGDDFVNGQQEPFSFSAISAQLTGMLSSILKSRYSPEPTSVNMDKHQRKNVTGLLPHGSNSSSGKDSGGHSPQHKRTGSQPLSASMTGNSQRYSQPTRHMRRQSSSAMLPPAGNLEDVVQPKFSTPDLLACLRVQDVLVRGQELDWNLGQCLDIFVHPSSLPDLYHELQFTPDSSCIVQITAIGPAADPSKSFNSVAPEDPNEATISPGSSVGHNSALSSGRSSSMSNAFVDPLTSEQSSQVSSPIPGMDISSFYQQEPLWKEETIRPSFVTARLCFASSLKLQKHLHEEGCGKECTVEKSVENVLPGHIILSNVLKMRLQIGSNSFVLLSKVLDQWRVIYPFNATLKYISITPLLETYHKDITAGFKHLVEECNRYSPFGFTFTENTIVPIPSCSIAESESNLCISVLTKHWSALIETMAHASVLERLQYSRFITFEGRSRIDSLVGHPDEEKAAMILNEVKEAIRGNKSPKTFFKHFCQHLIKLDRLEAVGNVILKELSQPLFVSSQDTILCRLSCQSQIYPKPNQKRIFQLMHRDVNHLSCKMNLADKKREQESLEPPRITLSIDQFGAMKKLFAEGCVHLMSLLSSQATEKAMLICGTGTGASGSSGCGKTSLAKLLCRAAAESDLRAHFTMVQCKMLRGKRLDLVFKALSTAFSLAKKHQPAVLLLDDMDQIMENITDEDIEVERRLRSYKNALFLIDCLQAVGEKVVVIATASSKSTLNSVLLNGRGRCFFSKMIEIPPPSLTDREEILTAIAHSRQVTLNLKKADLRIIALRTEGYQSEDLSVLMDRAIRQSYLRLLQPILTSFSPAQKVSVATLTGESLDSVSSHKSATWWSQQNVTFADFALSLEGHVPAALRGLNVHLGGEAGFESIGGLEEAKQTLRETLLWPSKYPRLFAHCPIKQHMGILLYGAPGTGKTLLAGAVAKEFGLNFVSIKGPEVLNKYIGMSEQAIRDLFARAQSARPCILFFDEFDSLVPLRGRDNTGVTDRVVNQLLTELDGVESLQGVYILAATSRPDLIDPALLRPGRIDKRLFCKVPTEEEREKILTALSKSLSKSEEVDFKDIASKTANFTGADLKALLYNAMVSSASRALRQQGEYDQILTLGIGSIAAPQQVDSQGHYNLEGGVLKEEDDSTPIVSPKSSPRWHPQGGSANSSFSEQFGILAETHSTPDKSRHQVRRNESESEREMVWEFSARDEGTVCMNSSQKLHEQEKGMVRRASLRALKMKKAPAVAALLNQEDLLEALEDTKPSLSLSEREKYMRIYNQVSGEETVSLKNVIKQVITHA